jgi:hypothetical protein
MGQIALAAEGQWEHSQEPKLHCYEWRLPVGGDGAVRTAVGWE